MVKALAYACMPLAGKFGASNRCLSRDNGAILRVGTILALRKCGRRVKIRRVGESP